MASDRFGSVVRLKGLAEIVKAPFAAKAPLVRVSGSEPPKRGSVQLLKLYSQAPWLRAVCTKIARGVAETEWKVYQPLDKKGGTQKDVQLARQAYPVREKMLKGRIDQDRVDEVNDHPILEMIVNGNEKLSGMQCLHLTQTYMDLLGEAFWILERNVLGVPFAYWPIPPTWITDFPKEGNPYYTVNGDNGMRLQVPVTEVLAFIDPDPLSPYGRGTGIAKSLGDELEIDEYAAKHTKAFFYNRARPDLIVHGDNLSPGDAKRLEEQWSAAHGGFWRAFKPLFFSRKLEIKELTQNMENLQVVQLRKHERDLVQQVFALPPEVLGIIGDSKRSTIAMADMFFTKDVLRPRVELIRTRIQR